MIVLGIIILLIGYLAPVPAFVITIGWIVLAIGVILLVLGAINRPVGSRRYWYGHPPCGWTITRSERQSHRPHSPVAQNRYGMQVE